MSGEPQDIFRDGRGRYKPGFNTRITRRMRIAAKLEELRHEFFPNGGASVMDANRLKLAAQHYFHRRNMSGRCCGSAGDAVRGISLVQAQAADRATLASCG
jgi:hypothetical protein